MPGRLSRFLNLERERKERPETKPVVSGRFGDAPPPPTAGPAAPPASATAADDSAAYDRAAGGEGAAPALDSVDPGEAMRARRAAATQSGIALDDAAGDEMPFLRCGLCESDNFRHAVKCQTCNARLDTDEQQAFNRGLWERRKAEAAQEAKELAELHARQKAAAPLGDGSAAYGALLAASVAEREQKRLGWMDPGQDPRAGAPIGMRLLRAIPHPLARLGVSIGLLGLACLLGYRSFTGGDDPRPWSQMFFFAVVALFVPWSRGLRRGW